MTTIKIKKGAGTPSGLTFGELAYDLTNKKLFIGITGGNALLANTDGGVASFNGLTGAVTGVTVGGTNVFTALNTFNAGISAAGGVTLAGTLQGTTANFTGLVSSTVGFSGPGTNLTNVAKLNVGNTFTATQTIAGSFTVLRVANTIFGSTAEYSSSNINAYSGASSQTISFSVSNPTNLITMPAYSTTLAGLAGTQTFSGTNTFTALPNFNAGISAAGGVTFSGTLKGVTANFTGLLSASAGISAAGGVTFSGTLQGTTANFTGLLSASAGISAAGTTAASFNGLVDMNFNTLYEPTLRYYNEPVSNPTITSNVLTVDLSTSQVFGVTLNAAINTFTISNTPATANRSIGFTLILTADGTARGITWGSPVKWSGGVTPTTTITNGKKDIFTFMTINGGTEWLGFIAGQNF